MDKVKYWFSPLCQDCGKAIGQQQWWRILLTVDLYETMIDVPGTKSAGPAENTVIDNSFRYSLFSVLLSCAIFLASWSSIVLESSSFILRVHLYLLSHFI